MAQTDGAVGQLRAAIRGHAAEPVPARSEPAPRLAGRLKTRGLLDLARMSLIPARRLAEEHFDGEGGALLLAGNALHSRPQPRDRRERPVRLADVLACPERRVPRPRGRRRSIDRSPGPSAGVPRRPGPLRPGSTNASLSDTDAPLRCEPPTAKKFGANRAILADVGAPQLYHDLLADLALPDMLRRDLDRFQWDAGTVKVDWALSAPVPWSAPDARQARHRPRRRQPQRTDPLVRGPGHPHPAGQTVPALRATIHDRPHPPTAPAPRPRGPTPMSPAASTETPASQSRDGGTPTTKRP